MYVYKQILLHVTHIGFMNCQVHVKFNSKFPQYEPQNDRLLTKCRTLCKSVDIATYHICVHIRIWGFLSNLRRNIINICSSKIDFHVAFKRCLTLSWKEFGCSNQYQCKKDKERRNCKMLAGNDWGINK